MLTNEDTDCIVQDISDAGDAPLGSIEKPSAIDAIQKHVEESLLFLDEEKSTLEKCENTTGPSHSKLNIVLEKSESNYTIMQDVDDSLRNIDKNTGEPLKISTVILKQDNPNDVLLSDELQKGESEIESVKTENKVELQFEKKETHYIPEQMETNDHILSIEDNPISASVLKEIDKDTAMNDPQEETSGTSDETDTIKVVVSREQQPHISSSDCAVNEINSDTVVNVSMEQKSEIPLLTNSDYSSLQFEKEETRDIPEQMETNDHILALEDNPISASVLKEIDKDTAMNDPQEETNGISDETNTIKVIVSREQQPHISSSDCAVNKINSDTVVNVSMEQKSEIPLLTNSDYSSLQFEKEETCDIPEQMETNDHILALEDNPISAGVLKKIDKVTAMNDPQEESSGMSNDSDTIKVIVSPEKHPPSDCVENEIDSDTVVNVSIEQRSEIPLLTNSYYGSLQFEKEETRYFIPEQIDTSKYIVSHEDDPPSDSAVHETDSDAVANDSQGQQSEILLLTEGKKSNVVSLEDNPTSDTVLKHINTDAISNDSENKSCELSSQIDDKKVRSALQEDNPLFLSTLNKTDPDATIYDSELKSSDISEQSAVIKVCNTSHEDNPSSENVLNETDTNDKTVNVQETASDISIVLHEGISPSDSLLDDTDADVTTNVDSLEKFGVNSMQISNVSKEQNSLSDSLLNKTDLDANMDDTHEGISEISQQIYEKDLSSEGVLDELGADVSTNGPDEETSDISDQFVINDISNISQENNNVLNETDIDASINVSQEIPELIQLEKVKNIYEYKVLKDKNTDVTMNDKNTDVTMNDSQEEISDISEIINSKDVSMVSQENISFDNVLNKTDTDVIMSNSQEEFHDMKTYNIDDSNISERDNDILNSELDKTDAVLLEECETDNKTIEASGNYQDNLKSITNENNVTVPQKDGILVESKEIINPTDETTQDLENTKTGDKARDQLPELESNAEKTVLSENDTLVKNKFEETGQATQNTPVKNLVWEIKSIKTGAEPLGKKELLQKERSQDKNAVENPKNPLVRALPLEDVSECPPAKRSRFQPVWKTNALNDEDKLKADQASSSDETAMDDNNITKSKEPYIVKHPYIITTEDKKQLQIWIKKHGIVYSRVRSMQEISRVARWNISVLRMEPIPKEYKAMDVFRIIRDKTEAYEKDISKNIQFIHIHKQNLKFNAAYIKWRDIDKLLVIKANLILASTCFTMDGAKKPLLFRYDNRSVIDWNEMERPLLKLGDGTIVIPESDFTLEDTPVVTPIATATGTTSATPVAATLSTPVAATLSTPVAATVSTPVAATVSTPVAATVSTAVAATVSTPVAATVSTPVVTPAATPVATPRPRKTPPTPFTDGKVNPKDRKCFGLSAAFMEYYNIKAPIGGFVFINNLDISHSVETYRRIFSAAGDIVDLEVIAPPPHSEPTSIELRIAYNHGLEAVQAVSMFHEQILHGRVIEVKMCRISTKRKPVEGFSTLGPGLGSNGFAMRNIRSSIELGKLKVQTKEILDNCKLQISSLRQKLSAATFKIEQNKRDEEKRRYKEEQLKIQSKNESQNKQANMNAVSAITNAIASSVQANVINMLGVQLNQQGQNIKQTPSVPVNNQPSGTPQNQNTPKAPLKWTANETARALPNNATALPNPATPLRNPTALLPNPTATLPNPTATLPNPTTRLPNPTSLLPNPTTPLPNPNVRGQTSMGNAFINSGGQLQTYENPQDPYGYYARLQQAYAQYGYHMDPTLLQAHAYLQPGTSYVQPIPPVDASYVPPTAPNSQSMPAIISNEPGPSKPSLTQSKVHTESKTVFPPLPNSTKNVTVYETKKTPVTADNKTASRTRFDVPPANLGQTTEPKSTVPEIPPIKPSHPAVKMAFKIQKPIVPPKETKPASIKINIPSVLPDTVPSVIQNPRTLEKHSAQKNYMNEGKLLEPWIKQIRDMRRNSKSPERTRKSPENIKSPDRSLKSLPKPMLPKGVKRLSRSPERRRNSRSPVRRNSRSPVRRNSRSPVRRNSRSPVRRRSRSTERRRASRSPKRRRSRSPIRRRSRSTERRRRSRSTDRRRMSRSPKRGLERSSQRGLGWSSKRGLERSPSPQRGLERSPQRGLGWSPKRGLERSPQRGLGRSPKRGLERSPKRGLGRSPKRGLERSPKRGLERSPKRGLERSPKRGLGRSPVRRRSRSPKRRDSKSPIRRKSRSPVRRSSRSPVRRDRRSPVRRYSKSPARRNSKSPVRRDKRSPVRRLSKSPVRSMSKSPVRFSTPASETKRTKRSRSSELGPKPTARPAYEPGAASSDITNMNLGDVTDDYNYEMQWNEMERELANTSVNIRFLPSSVTAEDLTEKMGEIGELLEVRAFGMGRAFVVFKFRNDAETCIEMYNMAKVDGQIIEVTWASIDDIAWMRRRF